MPEWQDIPTSATWIAASHTESGNKRKSKEILALDAAVAAYERLNIRGQAPPPAGFEFIKPKPMTTAEQSEALINILEATEVYLASKGGKHSKHRDAVVRDLRAVTRHLLAGVRWRKLQELAGGATRGRAGGGKRGLRPMTEHVWSEMHAPDHARRGGDMNPLPPDDWLRGVESGDIQERFLFQYLRNTRQALGKQADNVRYVEDEARWKYLVAFDDLGIARQRRQIISGPINMIGDPITTGGEPLGTSIYAMDESGNLYFQPSSDKGLNHCSFLAGRPVLCAGTVGITAGELGYIDNGSGHYRPTRRNLVNCLEKLANTIDLSRVFVRDWGGSLPLAAYNAKQYLDWRGFCAPAGYYNGLNGRYNDANNLHVFATPAESKAYVKRQVGKIEEKKLKEQGDPILAQMATTKRNEFKDNKEREIIQEALKRGVYTRIGIAAFINGDAQMRQWLTQHPEVT